MAQADIQVLVGVLGGGSISGKSGVMITNQLANIFGHINKGEKAKLKPAIDSNDLQGRVIQVVNQINGSNRLKLNFQPNTQELQTTLLATPFVLKIDKDNIRSQIQDAISGMTPATLPINITGAVGGGLSAKDKAIADIAALRAQHQNVATDLLGLRSSTAEAKQLNQQLKDLEGRIRRIRDTYNQTNPNDKLPLLVGFDEPTYVQAMGQRLQKQAAAEDEFNEAKQTAKQRESTIQQLLTSLNNATPEEKALGEWNELQNTVTAYLQESATLTGDANSFNASHAADQLADFKALGDLLPELTKKQEAYNAATQKAAKQKQTKSPTPQKTAEETSIDNLIAKRKEALRLELEAKKKNKNSTAYSEAETKRTQAYTDANDEYDKALQQHIKDYGDQFNKAGVKDYIDSLTEIKTLKEQIAAATEKQTTRDQSNAMALDKVRTKTKQYLDKVGGALAAQDPEKYKDLVEFYDKIAKTDDKGNFLYKGDAKTANQELLKHQAIIGKLGADYETLGQTVARVFKQKFGYAILAVAAASARKAISQLYTNVVELDSAMAQLKIVTGESSTVLQEYSANAAKVAKETGRTITEIMSSTETYARLGYSLEESLNLSEVTAKLANVAAIDTDTATTSMTSILKGFGLDPSDAENVGDMLTLVGQNWAISAEELGAALERGGASMAAANNTLEESIALLAAGNAAVQNAETVGIAMKTTTMRIRGTSVEELEEAGLATDGLVESTSKLQSQVKALAGVDIMKNANEYKSTYEIMVEIAEAWDDMSDVDQSALLELLAGKRNSQVLMSIIQNLKDLTGAYEDANNAAGTMAKANEIAMDTIEGKGNALAATYQQLSSNLLDSSLVKGLLDVAIAVVSGLNTINEATDGVIVQILMLIAAFAALRIAMGTIQASALAGGLDLLKKSFAGLTAAVSLFFETWAKSKSLTTAISGMWTLANPATKAALAISAVAAAMYGVYKISKKLNPSLDELKSKADEARAEANDMAETIQENKDRIEELNALKLNGTINLVEEQELTKLKEENRLLELQLRLKESIAEEAEAEAAEKATEEATAFINEPSYTYRAEKGDYYESSTSKFDDLQSQIDEYKRLKQDYADALAAGNAEQADSVKKQMTTIEKSWESTLPILSGWQEAFNLNDAEQASLFKTFQAVIDAIAFAMSDASDQAELFANIWERPEWEDAVTAIEDLSANGELTHESLAQLAEDNPFVAQLLAYLQQYCGLDFNNLTPLITFIEGISEDIPLATQTVTQMISKMEDDYDTLVTAQEEMKKAGVLSWKTISAMAANSDLEEYLVQTAGGYKLATGALNSYHDVMRESCSTALNEARTAARQVMSDQYGIQLALEATTEDYILQAKAALANATIASRSILTKTKSMSTKGVVINPATGQPYEEGIQVGVGYTSSANKDLEDTLADLEAALKQQKEFDSLWQSATKTTAAESSDDAYKDAVEKKIKALKHQLEMGEITEEQYYTNLENIMNTYYKNTVENQKKYEEEIWELEEELYNGRHELFQDWLNDQNKIAERLKRNGQAFTASNTEIGDSYRALSAELDELAEKWNDLNNGNVDYKNRKVLTAEDMFAAGWNSADDIRELSGSTGVTTYTKGYYGSDFTYSKKKNLQTYVEVTPILDNGSILSPSELDAYMEKIFQASDVLSADKVSNGGKGLIVSLWGNPTDEELDAYFEALDEVKNAHLDVWQEMQSVNSSMAKSSIDVYRNMISEIEKEIEAAYAQGLDANSDYVQELEEQMQEAAQNILDITKSVFDDYISYADDFNRWDNIGKDLDISKIEMLRAKLKSIQKLLDDGTISWEDYKDAYSEAAKSLYDTQKESIETIIDLTMAFIEQEAEDEIEALEDQADAYDELIEKKKELLEKTNDEADHEREVAELVREISKLKSKISQLSLDDSREAAAQRAELEEELYQKQLELSDLQNDYALDQTLEMLDKAQEANQDTVDAEKEAIEQSVDTWVKKYEKAIDRIDNDWDGLYKDLLDYQEEYRDSIDGIDSFETAWRNVEDTIIDVNENIADSISSTIKGIEDIYQAIENVGINPGTPNLNEDGSWDGTVSGGSSSTGSNKYSSLVSSKGRSIVQKMYNNSVKAAANPSLRDTLNQQNHDYAADYYWATGDELYYNAPSGTWHIGDSYNDPFLYEVYGLKKYHTGGYVGDEGAINDREVLSVLEKGELVLTKEHQANLKSIFNQLYSVVESMSSIKMPNFPLPATATSTGETSFHAEVNITHSGSMTEDDAKRYGDIAANAALEKFRSAFVKRGVR